MMIITYRLEIKMADPTAYSVMAFKTLGDAEKVAEDIAQVGRFRQEGTWGSKKVTGLTIRRRVETEEEINSYLCE